MSFIILPQYPNYRIYSNGQIFTEKNEIYLKPINNGNGYYFVNLWISGVQHSRYIHRLVAEAFIPNTENFKYVDHINRDKSNNSFENLRWTTASNNTTNYAGKPRYSVPRPCVHLSLEEKQKIIALKVGGLGVMEISRITKTPRQTVTGVLKKGTLC